MKVDKSEHLLVFPQPYKIVKRYSGTDIHKKKIILCILVGSLNRSKPEKQTKEFDTIAKERQARAQHIKQVLRRKPDRREAKWITELGRCDLVSGSYVPGRDIQDLRQFTRHRSSVKEDLPCRKNQVHDILHRSDIKLNSYLSDIFERLVSAYS